MKFAMIIDAVGGNMKSYQVRNGRGYDFNDNPFEFNISIGSDFYISIWNYPSLYEGGYFINWVEWGDDLPDLELDLIFLSIEKFLLNPDYTVDKIRKKYPNAKIAGLIKEIWMGPPYDYEHPKHKARIDFLNECDTVVTNRPELKEFQQIADNVDKPFNFVAIPANVDYLYDNFYKDKDLAIWAYIPNPMERRHTTYEFANYIGNKYNIPVRYKPLSPGQKFDYMPQKEFMTKWSSCAFHFNLDPIDYFPGNQCPLVAATGTINVGGVNDYHHILFPETATCDTDILEKRMDEYINNPKRYEEVVTHAWNKVNEVFGFEATRKQIENIKWEN
tara:strand:+ start:840 stop:1835 length:996 start_codon:yes stop_codon:yes gene_type:complete